jgi:chemotaxis protein methyltransferase CheR
MSSALSQPKTETSEEEFLFVSGILLRESGVVLESDKNYLIETRLDALAKREGLRSVSELIQILRKHSHPPLIKKVVSALTTHTTSFYRDLHPFEALKQSIIPELMADRANSRGLNLWSAACSSGQEPYSLAILLRESFPELKRWATYFLATDISAEALEHARKGAYRPADINRGLPARQLIAHFTQTAGEWFIHPEIRNSIDFRELNLAADWPPLPQMDLILMRNVLIYFGVQNKKKILQRALQLLRPNGYLMLGTTETTLGLDDRFESVTVGKSVFFRKRADA